MQPKRSLRSRAIACSAGAALLLPQAAHPVAFLPGVPAEPDPPTGGARAVPATPAEPAGSGIRWELGPWRTQGALTGDLRWLRLDDGTRSLQRLAVADLDVANHVHAPWFVQFRVGLSLLGDHASGSASQGGGSGSVSGRLALSVFPASRFPFELQADISDSRARGDALAGDLRSSRLSLSQAWRPEEGNDHVSLHVDHSRLESERTGADTLTAVSALATRQSADHNFELDASWSRNERSDTGDRSQLSSLAARHAFHPRAQMVVDTLASRSDVSLDTGGIVSHRSVRQIASVATWRPAEGEPLYRPGLPMTLGGSARWVEADGGDGQRGSRAVSANLGVSAELGTDWRLTGSAGAGRFDLAGGESTSSANANAAAAWAPAPRALGDWRWTPSVGGSVGSNRNSRDGQRTLAGLQLTQAVSRDWVPSPQQVLSLSLTQGAAVLRESALAQVNRSLSHGLALFWQSTSETGAQSFLGLSASDARNWSDASGRFQLVNLQWTQRQPFSRMLSASANLTLQATRNESSFVDAFTGERLSLRGGWQRYYTASVSVEHQRAFGVPRLRWSLLAAANSQQLERRAFGDVDAPRERIGASLESRLDYAIGRLESRLAARVARVDERTVHALQARVTRRY